eukprot:TRINITY_DN6996_c0_g1_i3.p1 TRINITY_DN6996_c0_g1~~TRINITY_DN6996_c0_g1_i3.p1  ORF type:complete len:108 (+),score=17.29 TRINITY_DN6996_c0_g1_i3:329-652(+)
MIDSKAAAAAKNMTVPGDENATSEASDTNGSQSASASNWTKGPWDHIHQHEWDVIHLAAEGHHADTTPISEPKCDKGKKIKRDPHSAAYNVNDKKARGELPAAADGR